MVNLHAILYDHGRLERGRGGGAGERARRPRRSGCSAARGSGAAATRPRCCSCSAGWTRPAGSSTRPASCSPRASTPSGPTWWRASCGCAGATSTGRAPLLERAEAAGSRIIDPHLLAPLYASAGGDRDLAGRRRGRGPRGRRTALRRLDQVRAPRPPRAGAGRGRDGRTRAPIRRGWRMPGRCWTGRAALAGGRRRRRALRRRSRCSRPRPSCPATSSAWRRRGHRLGAAGRALPGGVRPPAGRRGAAGAPAPTATRRPSTWAWPLATARRIGADGLVSRAEDLGRRARLKVEAAPENPYRLTAREAEVLRLVADGLSDREIGARLFISHRTVERHVSNLLSKLGAARRAELVATALREGLLQRRFVCGLTCRSRRSPVTDESGLWMTSDPSAEIEAASARDRPARRRFVCRLERGSTRRTADESRSAAGGHRRARPGAGAGRVPMAAAGTRVDGQPDRPRDQVRALACSGPGSGGAAKRTADLQPEIVAGSPARWRRCRPHSSDLVPTGRPGVEGGRGHDPRAHDQGRSCRSDRGLLLPPDQTALRPVGAPGAFRTSTAAD